MEEREAHTDGQLLAGWLAGSEEDFAELVDRHGSMVLGVCRRVLGPGSDAEDAAQAVMVALSRKARSLRGRPDLGAWLHRAAWFAATRAVRSVQRRKAHERAAGELRPAAAGGPAAEDVWSRVGPHLDAALNGLPEKYRRALTACYLEGRSQAEAARSLGLPEGTVASQCKRGLERLRRRLSARGVRLEAGALGPAVLAGAAAGAALPAGFVKTVLGAVGGSAAAKVLVILEGIMRTLLWVKIKKAAAVAAALLAMGLAAPATVLVVRAAAAGEPAGTLDSAEVAKQLAAMKARIQSLEMQVKNLRLEAENNKLRIARLGSAPKTPRDLRREAAEATAKIDRLAAAVRRMKVDEAAKSGEFAELAGMIGHENAAIRKYLVNVLVGLPGELASAKLAGMVARSDYETAAAAVGALRAKRRKWALAAAADRAGALTLHSSAPDYRYREAFVMEASLYLAENGDVRGLAVYMKAMGEQLAEIREMKARGAVSILSPLMRTTRLNQFSAWCGCPLRFKRSHPNAHIDRGEVGKLLEWWRKNGGDVKEIHKAGAAGGAARPGGDEKF
jgi:RNA polymerase sigma factor (sigma-70 family)